MTIIYIMMIMFRLMDTVTIIITLIMVIMFRLVDTANYSCVAANSARQRTSPAALVTVYSKFNMMMMMIMMMTMTT